MRREQIQSELHALRVALTPCDHTDPENPHVFVVDVRDLRPGGSGGVFERIYHCQRCGEHWIEKPTPETGDEPERSKANE